MPVYLILNLIVAVLAILIFVISPLVIYCTLRMPGHPEFSRINPESFPDEVLAFFNLNTKDLEKEGFTKVLDAVQTGSATDPTAYIRLLVNQNAGDEAMCVYSEIKVKNTKHIEKYVEFCSEFSSNKEISTNNSNMPAVFKQVPEKQVFKFPNISDLHRLYEIHTRETGKFVDKYSRKILPPKGRELERLTDSMIKDMERQVRMGYFYLDRPARVYRPTLKGAYFMTWDVILKLFDKKKR